MAFEPYIEAWMRNVAKRNATKIERPQARFLLEPCPAFPCSTFPCPAFRRPQSSAKMFGCGLVLLLASAVPLAAQTGNPASTASAGHSSASPSKQPVPSHKIPHRTRHHRARKNTPVVVAPVPPPPLPVPPAQQQAHPATVDFSQGRLRIKAENSSLVQILNQVSRQTGIAVEGLSHDERIYGQYGPGSVTGTLTKLLDGAGYNYVIVGGDGNRPPTKLILTPGSNAGAGTPAAATRPAAPSNPAQAPSAASGSDPSQPKTPQQIFDELRRMHPH